MAQTAEQGPVSACEGESPGIMFLRSERRRGKSLDRMAARAVVAVDRGELAPVPVRMAIRTFFERQEERL